MYIAHNKIFQGFSSIQPSNRDTHPSYSKLLWVNQVQAFVEKPLNQLAAVSGTLSLLAFKVELNWCGWSQVRVDGNVWLSCLCKFNFSAIPENNLKYLFEISSFIPPEYMCVVVSIEGREEKGSILHFLLCVVSDYCTTSWASWKPNYCVEVLFRGRIFNVHTPALPCYSTGNPNQVTDSTDHVKAKQHIQSALFMYRKQPASRGRVSRWSRKPMQLQSSQQKEWSRKRCREGKKEGKKERRTRGESAGVCSEHFGLWGQDVGQYPLNKTCTNNTHTPVHTQHTHVHTCCCSETNTPRGLLVLLLLWLGTDRLHKLTLAWGK